MIPELPSPGGMPQSAPTLPIQTSNPIGQKSGLASDSIGLFIDLKYPKILLILQNIDSAEGNITTILGCN